MRRKILTIAAAVALAAALPLAGCGSNSSGSAPKSIDSSSVQSAAPEQTQSAVKYPAGMYQIGEDIPAGEYVFTRDEGEEFLMVDVWEDFEKDDANLAVIHQWFTEDEAFLRVSEGQTLKVQHGKFSAVESAPSEPYLAGLYQVGKDMPSGGYIFTRDEEEEFLMVDVWDDFEKDDANLAVVHQWFTEEEAFLKVSDGQVLRVQHGTFASAQ